MLIRHRLLRPLLFLCIGLALAACGESGLSPPPVPTVPPPAPTASAPVVVTPPPMPAADPALFVFKAASAQRTVNPTMAQLTGVAAGTAPDTYLQQFNLGGYGGTPVPDSLPALLHFDIGGDPAKGSYEPIHVKALVIEGPQANGTKRRIAFVTLDATGAGNVIQKNLKAAVAAASGIAKEDVFFGVTHSHSSADLQGLWGGVPAGWIDCAAADASKACNPSDQRGLYQLAAAAVKEAVDKLQPARLKLASAALNGEARLNNYRRCNPTGTLTSDPRLTILQPVDASGAALGTLVQYAAHPTVLGGNNRLVHSDFVGSAMLAVERRYGAVALYYNGPIADASPRPPAAADDYAKTVALGEAMGNAVEAAIKANSRDLTGPLAVAHTQPFLVATNPLFTAAGGIRAFNGYYEFGTAESQSLPIPAALKQALPQTVVGTTTQVSRISIGSGVKALEMVTIPGEAARNFGESIRRRAATPDMMLLGLTHDTLGYIIPANEFGDRPQDCGQPYEETVSLGPLTAPLLDAQAYGPLFGQTVPAP